MFRMVLVWLALALGSLTASAQEMREAPPLEMRVPLDRPIPEGWTTIVGPVASVKGPPEAMDYMLEVQARASTRMRDLTEQLRMPLPDPITIYVSPDTETFRRLQGSVPQWADATAWPRTGEVFLRMEGARGGSQNPWQTVLDHELVHIIVGQAFLPNHPPSWLQEGMAKVFSREVSPDLLGQLTTLQSWRTLSGRFPENPMDARSAYAQSTLFVGFLMSELGEEGFATFFRTFAATGDVQRAAKAAGAKDFTSLDKAWREPLTATRSWLPFNENLDGLWMLTGVALLLVGWSRRRRFVDRMRRRGEVDQRLGEMAAEILHREITDERKIP